MNWIELSIYTSSHGVDIIPAKLMDIGINSFMIEDKEDFISELEANKDNWNMLEEDLFKFSETNIKVYIEDNQDKEDIINEIKRVIEDLKKENEKDKFGSLKIIIKTIKNEDWENNWKDYFHSFELGENIVIKPLWEDYDKSNKDKIVIEIDPGLSFGTGTHETTKLCILMLRKYIKAGERVIDVGCGSGILSVAALKFGAKEVSAVDIDPLAVDVTKHSMEINGIKNGYEILTGDLTDKIDKKADIIVANIFAHIIIRLIPDAYKLLNSGGIFITSGIIEEGVEGVKEEMRRNGFDIIEVEKMGDWYAIVSRKQS